MEKTLQVTPLSALPDELSLCRLWNSGRLPTGCRTFDGRSVEVIYRGQWTRGYGPDFRNALICIDSSRLVRGDVEVHVRSSDWRSHGHSSNPVYDRVILHVVWLVDTVIDHPSPLLELSAHVSLEALKNLPELGSLDESLCAVFAQPASAPRAMQLIEAAGDERFAARCDTFEGELECDAPEQVLYAALMECMGYSENKLPFRLLAAAVPLESLAGRTAADVDRRLALASGLLPGTDRGAILSRDQWHVGRVRPPNHPLRRMRGIATILARADAHGGLLQYLLMDGIEVGETALLDRLTVDSEDGPAYIGMDRAIETAVNAVLPIAVAHARRTGNASLKSGAQAIWQDLPRTAISRVERSMREHLAMPPRARLLTSARHQQGLLHLYKRFCAQRLCDACPLAKLGRE